MQIFLNLAFFSLILFGWGYLITSTILKERRISFLIPFSLLLGFSSYVFFVNIISYLIPIKTTIWLVYLVALILCVIGIKYGKFNPKEIIWDFSPRRLKILFGIALVISIVSGFISVRSMELDDLTHIAFSAPMSVGNFPAIDPTEPDYALSYHYAPSLLSVIFKNIAGVPLWLGLDIQAFFFSGLTFLVVFLLAFYLIKNFYYSVLSSLLFFYGSGMLFFNFTEGISPLIDKYNGLDVVAPWKFIASMVIPQVNIFFSYGMYNHSGVMGTVVMIFVIYLFFKTVEAKTGWISLGLVNGLMFGYLALILETNFAILAIAFSLITTASIILFFRDVSRRELYRKIVVVLLLVVFIGSVVAFLQGGILSHILDNNGRPGFSLNKQPLILDVVIKQNKIVPVFSFDFVKEFGLSLFLLLPGLYILRKNRKILTLAIVGLIAFIIPFLVVYSTPWEMRRFFTIATPFFSLLTGFMLFELNKRKVLGLKTEFAIVVLSVLSGLIFNFVSMITPIGMIGELDSPLIAKPKEHSQIEKLAHSWVINSTATNARFFPYDFDFIGRTGRMTPGFFANFSSDNTKIIYDDMFNNCSKEAIKKLGIEYFYIYSEISDMKNFEKNCISKLNTELIYQSYVSGEYVKIYKNTSI